MELGTEIGTDPGLLCIFADGVVNLKDWMEQEVEIGTGNWNWALALGIRTGNCGTEQELET